MPSHQKIVEITNDFFRIRDLQISLQNLYERLSGETKAAKVPATISRKESKIAVHVTPLNLDVVADARIVKTSTSWMVEFVFYTPDMNNQPLEVARLYLDDEGMMVDQEGVRVASAGNTRVDDQICEFVMVALFKSTAFDLRPCAGTVKEISD